MVLLGVVLLVIGYVAAIPILVLIGWILAGIGVVLLLIGTLGHREVMGRRYWW